MLVTPSGGAPTAEDVSSHELSHFWLHASTPYGLVLDELAEAQQRATLEYCQRLHSAGRRIPISAVEVARRMLRGQVDRSHPDHALLHEVVQTHVVPWSHEAFLERWLEGADAKSVRTTDLSRTLRWLVDFEEQSRRIRPDEELFSDRPPQFSDYQRRLVRMWGEVAEEHPEKAPRFPTTGPDQRPLGAAHLFEAHAQLSERTNQEFWSSAADDTRAFYWGLLGAFMQRFPGKVHDADSFASMVATFIAVVELALMVPVGRVYGRMRDDQMLWFDLHPGWRCAGLLNGIEDADWLVEDGEAVPQLLGRLSRRRGWKSPERFLELGAALEPVTQPIARHAAACRARLEEPDLLVVPRALPDRARAVTFLNEHLPIMIRGAESVVPGADTSERLGRLLNFTVACTTVMVMQRGRFDLDALFPPGLDFTNIFSNITDREQLLAIFDDALPFLSREAFCSVDALS